ALDQPRALGAQLAEILLLADEAHALEQVERAEPLTAFEHVPGREHRVRMGGGIERAGVPGGPVGPGHRQRERLAPQLTTALFRGGPLAGGPPPPRSAPPPRPRP